MKAKKIPMRMCLGCREMKPKKELIRIVRGQDGTVKADATGKLPGRGGVYMPQEGMPCRLHKFQGYKPGF